MKTLALFILGCTMLAAQEVRIDPLPVFTTTSNQSTGLLPVFAVPGASAKLCVDPACSSLATTFTDQTGTTPCPGTAQVTQPGSNTCTPYATNQGAFGFWVAGGNYWYQITLASGATIGPYPVSAGGSGSGSMVYPSSGIGVSTGFAWSASIPVPIPVASGGTGATTAAAAFSAISPLTTPGDMLYEGASAATRLPQPGNGVWCITWASSVPTWTICPTPGAGTQPIIGTFTGTGVTIPTTSQGAHPIVNVYDSSGQEVIAAVACKNSGGTQVGCADSTSVGTIVIGPVSSGTYTYSIYGATGGFPNPLTTQGDVMYESASGPARLGAPANGTWCFSFTSAVPSWANCPGASGANTTLSNLTAPTNVNQSLIPAIDNTYGLGNTTQTWIGHFYTLNVGESYAGAGSVTITNGTNVATLSAHTGSASGNVQFPLDTAYDTINQGGLTLPSSACANDQFPVVVAGSYTCGSPIRTPAATPTMGTISASTTGGTIAAGTYYVVLSYCAGGAGTCSLPSAEQSVTTTGSTSSITVPFTANTPGLTVRVYIGTSPGAEGTFFTALAENASYTITTTTGTSGTPAALNGQYMFQVANGLLTQYNGVTTAGFGQAAIYASISLTGQTASIATTNLTCTSQICPPGEYEVKAYADVSAFTASGAITVTMGWFDVVAHTAAVSTVNAATVSSTSSTAEGSMRFYTDGSHQITYATTVTGTYTYGLRLVLERIQ